MNATLHMTILERSCSLLSGSTYQSEPEANLLASGALRYADPRRREHACSKIIVKALFYLL